MTAPADPQLDAVAVAVVVIGAIAGGEVARYAGPYLVIAAGGVVGSAVAVMRHPDHLDRWQALGMVALLTSLSLLLTGAAAYGIEVALAHVGWPVPSRYLLVPISIGIAAVGRDWPAVLSWAARLFRRRAERAAGGAE